MNQLERLVRLRDNGGLSETEFEAEKAKILDARQSHSIPLSTPVIQEWILPAGAVIIVFLVIFLIAINLSSTDDQYESPVEAMAPAIQDRSGLSADNKLPSEGTYEWATSSFRIGENPNYIESILGASRKRSSDSMIYDIDGCFINFLIEGTAVSGIQMGLSPKCTPIIKDRVITEKTKLLDVIHSFGLLQTPCLSLCGNKADPFVEYVVAGSHAENFIGVSYMLWDAERGVDLWSQEIVRAKGVKDTFDVPEGGFHCPPTPSQSVLSAMMDAEISSVTIGLNVDKCAPW